jgi:hypothetical protein
MRVGSCALHNVGDDGKLELANAFAHQLRSQFSLLKF